MRTKRHNKNKIYRRTIKIKQARCSPKRRDKFTGFSCYTFDDLRYLRNLWNAQHPRGDPKHINTDNGRRIYDLLVKYNSNACGKNITEACLLNQSFVPDKVRKQIKEFVFAPLAPTEWKQKPNEWLSSADIEDVIKQYEKAHKEFKFLGTTPIDFDAKMGTSCVSPSLCHFSLAKLHAEGKTKIGAVLNTDSHDKPGSHWICLFIDIPKRLIYFFDSTGVRAPKEIMDFVGRVSAQGLNMSPPMHFRFEQNYPKVHQRGNTECGNYTLYVIIGLLRGKLTPQYLKTHTLSDKYIEKFRKLYFNSSL